MNLIIPVHCYGWEGKGQIWASYSDHVWPDQSNLVQARAHRGGGKTCLKNEANLREGAGWKGGGKKTGRRGT